MLESETIGSDNRSPTPSLPTSGCRGCCVLPPSGGLELSGVEEGGIVSVYRLKHLGPGSLPPIVSHCVKASLGNSLKWNNTPELK
ncbi:hypothetical protein PBY51_002419 [Eleginops maclovinus]|uniref:Uncharacterized protein n=1 Tax=Eleginops maclovinus TaxID=56733 RepID=A0AAN8AD31_ELEMC|nr:hypothetical protein PBY51_002419 [Eleginops maclovinus]